jgi:hypothetical protein
MTIPEPPDESGAQPVEEATPKARRSLSRIKRELSDEELSTSGVQKMLIDEVERLDDENRALQRYRDRYYVTETQAAVLKEKLQSNTAIEVIINAAFAVGAAALGYVPAVWSTQPTGWITLIFGGCLIAAGILAKVARR